MASPVNFLIFFRRNFRLHRFIGDLAASTAERFGLRVATSWIFRSFRGPRWHLGYRHQGNVYLRQNEESLTLRPGYCGVSPWSFQWPTQNCLKIFLPGPMFRYGRAKRRYNFTKLCGITRDPQPQADAWGLLLSNMLLKGQREYHTWNNTVGNICKSQSLS